MSPSSTESPSVDGDLDDGALHRRGDGVAGGRSAGLLAGRALGLLRAGRAAADSGEPAGEHDLEPAAADLDGDLVALVGLGGLGGAPAYGVIWLSKSVSIHCV